MICAVCFGDPMSPMTLGFNYGILTLLAVVGVMMLTFGCFFINIYKRSRPATSVAGTVSNLQ